MNAIKQPARILVTGATGYVGGRLWRKLEGEGVHVRCMARDPLSLTDKVGATTEVVQADIFSVPSLEAALEGIETAFYLIHSMGSAGNFEDADREGASNFAQAAERAGVNRIIYLGGLGDASEDLSPHLRSRHEVGQVLGSTSVDVLELRASIVLGAGSLSFEMIKSLVDRLPVMITPRWVEVDAQPIGIDDLLSYLIESITIPLVESRVFEIGGPERLSYGQLMNEYAAIKGLRRFMIRVPVLTPRLSSLWLGLVTPLYARIGKKLIESIVHPTVVHDQSALEVFKVRPITIRESITRAIDEGRRQAAQTRWSDSISSGGEPKQWTGVSFGKRLQDSRWLSVNTDPTRAFLPIQKIGGEEGWYACNWLWSMRGFLDLLIGGVGVRRGRTHPVNIGVGDALDFWRVEAFEQDKRLLLRAEMKLPGKAWLEFVVEESEEGSMIRQTASFDPAGWMGAAYWYLISPLHGIVFSRMLRSIADRSMQASPQ
jgi:uncharacterized protein YbjT (DUF2867 family)